MLRDRIRRIRESEGLSRRDMEKRTGIPEYKWGNVEKGTQKVNEEHILSVVEHWPQYAYWLITGKTLPQAGQISPEKDKP